MGDDIVVDVGVEIEGMFEDAVAGVGCMALSKKDETSLSFFSAIES